MATKFLVKVTNEILGDSEHIMSMQQIANFNLCALMLAQKCTQTGIKHTDGMWSVEKYVGTDK